ncbi:MAG TPA: SpoIIE family protein phosphatase [Acidimicrobiia bacterium]|nr:SpoIIE family protein phosphatase [Acidimicrobiia bacterium]
MPGDRFIELAMRDDRHVLDVLFRHAREAITVQDAAGRLVYANDLAAGVIGFRTAEELLKASPTELVGRSEMVDQNGDVLSTDRLPGRRVLMGEKVVEEVIGYRVPGSHRVRWSRVNASPIKNDAGETVLALNFFTDITDQVRRDETGRLLASANELLGGSLDLEENLAALAKLLVPQLGSWCEVHLIGDDGTLASVALIHPDSPEADLLISMRQGERMSLDSDRMPARVARTRKPEVVAEITPEMLAMAEEVEGREFVDLFRRFQVNSVVCVPLQRGSQVIGALSLARTAPDLPFDDSDVEVLVSVADRAAVTLENARLYQHEHEVSQVLQRGLMPRFLPVVDGLVLAARYRPLTRIGHVGGDFYDVIPLSAELCALVVGDIEGKGIAAAAAVGLARHTVRAIVNVDPSPAVVIGALNLALIEEDQRMCTLAYVLLDRQGDRFDMKVALAGHPPPLLVSSDGTSTRLGSPCPPAGVIPSIEPIEEHYSLTRGDTLLIYTDGFAVRGEAPPESVEAALGPAHLEELDPLLDRLLAHVRAATDDKVHDDIALLAARAI